MFFFFRGRFLVTNSPIGGSELKSDLKKGTRLAQRGRVFAVLCSSSNRDLVSVLFLPDQGGKKKSKIKLNVIPSEDVVQVSMGTSSSEVVSSDSGMSSTSSSKEEEEEEEKDGEAERGKELVEKEGEDLKRERLRLKPVWKMEAREGLLGGTATGGVLGESEGGAGGA